MEDLDGNVMLGSSEDEEGSSGEDESGEESDGDEGTETDSSDDAGAEHDEEGEESPGEYEDGSESDSDLDESGSSDEDAAGKKTKAKAAKAKKAGKKHLDVDDEENSAIHTKALVKTDVRLFPSHFSTNVGISFSCSDFSGYSVRDRCPVRSPAVRNASGGPFHQGVHRHHRPYPRLQPHFARRGEPCKNAAILPPAAASTY